MIPRLLGGCFAVLALAAPLGAIRLMPGAVPVESDAGTPPAVSAETTPPKSGVRALLRLAEEQTPFRPDGELPFLRFGESPPPPMVPPLVAERPKLIVSGVVWGAEPVAIVEGLPGRDQPVALGQGGSEGGFRVTRIERDRVTISGMDTIWVLRVREAW